ncbi:hypothetical protein T4A_5339, partial [Trichinella pseudospiralis]
LKIETMFCNVLLEPFSGTWTLLMKPLAGQNTPTQISNIAKPVNTNKLFKHRKIGNVSDTAAHRKMYLKKTKKKQSNLQNGKKLFMRYKNNFMKNSGRQMLAISLKIDEPIMMQIINEAKIKPCGTKRSFGSGELRTAAVNTGVHSSTNVYMLPSNKDCTTPR